MGLDFCWSKVREVLSPHDPITTWLSHSQITPHVCRAAPARAHLRLGRIPVPVVLDFVMLHRCCSYTWLQPFLNKTPP